MAARRHRRPRTKKCSEKRHQRLVMILGDRCKSEKKAELEPAAVVLTADMVRDRVRSRPRKGAIELQSTTSAEQDPAAQVCAKAPIVQGELPSVPSTSTTEATPAAVCFSVSRQNPAEGDRSSAFDVLCRCDYCLCQRKLRFLTSLLRRAPCRGKTVKSPIRGSPFVSGSCGASLFLGLLNECQTVQRPDPV
ncbi:unnamed protein product [Trichogramma brassicae]|uniref:Uncharacterized protein n=1 Tax=Trichogramma brassicae TaxID=86971 RepID=A0A6H5HXF8_9HYME|nr:unnamed protein product [Trichogramma brassicae]